MTDLGIRFEVTGDIRAEMRAEVAKSARAVTGAMRRIAPGLKEELRGQVREAGLGQRLANTWRGEAFPRTGASLGAVAAVWSKAPTIVRAHNEGALVRSGRGVWLAIPSENAPKMSQFRRVTPSNFPEATLGRLRFVAVKGRRLGLLVVDGLRKHTGARRGFERATRGARARGDFQDSVIMFYLVPQAQLRKKLDVEGAADAWSARLPSLISAEFDRLDQAEANA